jgi:hypothetical protein
MPNSPRRGLSGSIAHDHAALGYHFDPSPFRKMGRRIEMSHIRHSWNLLSLVG